MSKIYDEYLKNGEFRIDNFDEQLESEIRDRNLISITRKVLESENNFLYENLYENPECALRANNVVGILSIGFYEMFNQLSSTILFEDEEKTQRDRKLIKLVRNYTEKGLSFTYGEILAIVDNDDTELEYERVSKDKKRANYLMNLVYNALMHGKCIGITSSTLNIGEVKYKINEKEQKMLNLIMQTPSRLTYEEVITLLNNSENMERKSR